jgi:hypothetical protein
MTKGSVRLAGSETAAPFAFVRRHRGKRISLCSFLCKDSRTVISFAGGGPGRHDVKNVKEWQHVICAGEKAKGNVAINGRPTSVGVSADGLHAYTRMLTSSHSTRIVKHVCLCALFLSCRRVLGFWLALTFGTALQAVAFGVLISRFNWNKEVQRAAAMLRAAHCSRGDSIGSS